MANPQLLFCPHRVRFCTEEESLSGYHVGLFALFTEANRRDRFDEEQCMSFGIYALGFAILIGGLLYIAHLMHIPQHWIIAGGVVMAGIGILSAVKATRQKDPAK